MSRDRVAEAMQAGLDEIRAAKAGRHRKHPIVIPPTVSAPLSLPWDALILAVMEKYEDTLPEEIPGCVLCSGRLNSNPSGHATWCPLGTWLISVGDGAAQRAIIDGFRKELQERVSKADMDQQTELRSRIAEKAHHG